MNGKPVLAAGVIMQGEALVTIPYRYRHTAVLTEDVTGFSLTVPGVQAPKGASGFYAGTFVSDDRVSRPFRATGPSDMWCFLPKLVGGSRDTICLFRNEPGVAAIAPARLNPWMWETFFPATGSFDYVNTPIFEKREVEIPGNLKLEYRFNGWTTTEIEIIELAVGREVHRFKLGRDKDGVATLNTVAGRLLISPAPGNSTGAVVTLEPAPIS